MNQRGLFEERLATTKASSCWPGPCQAAPGGLYSTGLQADTPQIEPGSPAQVHPHYAEGQGHTQDTQDVS